MHPSALLLALCAGPAAPAAAAGGEIVASLNRGNDEAGDGSAAAPYRTVTKALAAARAAGAALVRLEYGTYEQGEAYPLALPAGIELRGIGAGGSVLRGGADVLVRLEPGDGETVLAGLSLSGAGAATGIGLDLAPEAGLPVSALLRGVTLEGLGTGVRARTGEAALRLTGTGLRAVDCGTGIDAEGTGELALELADAAFERCRVGLLLRAAEGAELTTYDGPPARHALALRRTAFVDCSEAGLARRGAAGTNEGPPYLLEDCLFQGNETGIDLQRPAADTPIRVLSSRFLWNRGFGLRASGQEGNPAAVSTVEACEFRWNGVGLHVTNAHVVYEVRRAAFLDHTGNALFLSNFQTAPLKARVESCLIAGNGGAGIYTMADGERIAVEVLHCTVLDNGAAGVHRKTRHAGKSTLELRGSIVAGNAPDLEKIEPAEVFRSLIGDGSAGAEQGNLSGAPLFVDPARRDYRLRADSPCVDGGEPDPRLSALDVAGRPRAAGPPDLGACEREP